MIFIISQMLIMKYTLGTFFVYGRWMNMAFFEMSRQIQTNIRFLPRGGWYQIPPVVYSVGFVPITVPLILMCVPMPGAEKPSRIVNALPCGECVARCPARGVLHFEQTDLFAKGEA